MPDMLNFLIYMLKFNLFDFLHVSLQMLEPASAASRVFDFFDFDPPHPRVGFNPHYSAAHFGHGLQKPLMFTNALFASMAEGVSSSFAVNSCCSSIGNDMRSSVCGGGSHDGHMVSQLVVPHLCL